MGSPGGDAERRWRPPRPLDLLATLGVIRRGGGDPTWQSQGRAGFLKGWQTPVGPVTVLLRTHPEGEVEVKAWGEGRDWVVDHAPDLVGEGDDDSGFVPHHAVVRDLAARHAGWRTPSTHLVLESLVPAIIEQRVTGREAFAAYRALVRRFGHPAPGPGAELGLLVPPTAREWAAIPSWEWTLAGVDAGRARTAVGAAHHAGRLEEAADDVALACRRLASLPGVGRWSVAEVAHVALGDSDAVSFGDYHVARNIGWVLTGRVIDDDGLAELLAPYAGHRYRVQRLVELAGLGVPRRGPRRSLPTHLPRRTAR